MKLRPFLRRVCFTAPIVSFQLRNFHGLDHFDSRVLSIVVNDLLLTGGFDVVVAGGVHLADQDRAALDFVLAGDEAWEGIVAVGHGPPLHVAITGEHGEAGAGDGHAGAVRGADDVGDVVTWEERVQRSSDEFTQANATAMETFGCGYASANGCLDMFPP